MKILRACQLRKPLGYHAFFFLYSGTIKIQIFLRIALIVLSMVPAWNIALAKEIVVEKPDSQKTKFDQRRQRVILLGDPKYLNLRGPKQRTYDLLAATALKGCGPSDWPEYMAGVPTQKVDDNEPMEMFALPPLVRYLFQFNRCLPIEQRDRLLSGLTRRQRLTGGGTTNHAIMRAASWYLLAQFFPSASWTDWDGKKYSSQELMTLLKPRLAARTARFYRSGSDEWLSPTYAIVNISPLLNLYDFATDEEVITAANKEVSLLVGTLYVDSFHGVLVPPLTRRNYDQRNAPGAAETYIPSVGQQVLWYYFGEPSMSDFDLQSRKEPFFITMLAQSKWTPATEILQMRNADSGGYSLQITTASFGDWGKPTPPAIYGDAFISDRFAIGTGNIVFDPSWYNDHNQTFGILIKSPSPRNQVECFQPYWTSNQGEDYWEADRSSPFQQMYRYDTSSVVMLFDIPEKDPWKYGEGNRFYAQRNQHADNLLRLFQCRIPKSLQEIITEPAWIFLRQDDVFVAIGTLSGIFEYDTAPPQLKEEFVIAKVRQAKSALFFRVEQARPDDDFGKFQKRMRQAAPTYEQSTSSVLLNESSGVATRIAFKLRQLDDKYWASVPSVIHGNSNSVPPSNDQIIKSPFLSLRSGVLEIKTKQSQLRLSQESTR